MITNLKPEELRDISVQVKSITRTCGGRILLTLYVQDIDYVQIDWPGHPMLYLEKGETQIVELVQTWL